MDENQNEPWVRLGQMLTRRRLALGYRTRPLFIDAKGLKHGRIVADLENGARSNYDQSTLIEYEMAYELAPGSLRSALLGGELTPITGRQAGQPAGVVWEGAVDRDGSVTPWPGGVDRDDPRAIEGAYAALQVQYAEADATARFAEHEANNARAQAVSAHRRASALAESLAALADRMAELKATKADHDLAAQRGEVQQSAAAVALETAGEEDQTRGH